MPSQREMLDPFGAVHLPLQPQANVYNTAAFEVTIEQGRAARGRVYQAETVYRVESDTTAGNMDMAAA